MIIFTEPEKWLDCVVGAMINFETGLVYFKNGEFVPEELDKEGKPKPRAPAATFVRKNRTVTIMQFGSGLLMIAKISSELINSIEGKLEEMYKKAGFSDSNGVLYKRRSVHTAAEHLSRITTVIAEDQNTEEAPVISARRFVELNYHGGRGLDAAFTWFYTNNIGDFLTVMSYDSYDTIPVTLQFSGIIYDPMHWFHFKHGETITRNLTFHDVKWVRDNLVKTCTYGNIDEVMQEAVKCDLKPTNAKRFPLLLGVTVKEYERHCKNPAYIPGFTRDDAGIHICPTRGPFFEIHKWLGRPEMFSGNVHIDSMFGVIIYDVELKDIVWGELRGKYEKVPTKVAENTLFKSLKPEQVCQRCQIPLYDRAYAVFPDMNSRVGTPYCPTCMHQRYTETGLVDMRGNLLCKGKILASFTPALKLTDVLMMLPNQDQEYLDILQDKFTVHRYVEKENDKGGFVLVRGTRYIGLTGSLRAYIEVCIRWGNITPTKLFMCQVVQA